MKKTISVIILSSLLLSLGTGILAKEDLPSPGITPDSIFYFIDILGEKIGLLFAFSAEKKAAQALKYADEKLAEVIKMAEEEEIEALEKANEKYQEYLDLANEQAQKLKKKDAEELGSLIAEKTLEHQEVLSEVLEEASEKTKKEIEGVIETTKEGFEKAFEILPEDEQEEWGEEVERLENEEVEKMVSAFFEYIIAEDYDKAFSCIVNIDGTLPSEEDKQNFIREVKKRPIIDYSINQITDYDLDEDLIADVITKVKVVEFTVIFTEDEETKGGFGAGYLSGQWKIIINMATASSTAKIKPPSTPSVSEESVSEELEETTKMPVQELECKFNEIIFYYSDTCGPCQKVKDDGTLEKIEKLGVKVNQVDIATDQVQHEFSAIPAFIIDKKVYIGYKTFEQIKDLLNCQ
ncbi:hypothetical protein AMJ47_03505 [Parcubacteria bacterium DG_72]|nr:MAG: hypothetical protein AMJ47_03505 [Parcubacteria bacterium DG_72]